jgi:hypothetical protein
MTRLKLAALRTVELQEGALQAAAGEPKVGLSMQITCVISEKV